MKKDISPEERLLRLIKASPGQKPQGDTAQTAAKSQPSKKPFFKFNILSNLSKIKSLNIYNLKFANKFLLVLIILSLVYFLLSSILFRPPVSLKLAPIAIDNKIKELTQPIPEQKPFSYYANEINKRDLFQSSQPQSVSSKGNVSSDITKELNLLGIVKGDKPQAIIEDQKTKKSYFLNIGDSINGLIVESIGEGKVTLDFNGQKIDLFL